MARPAQTRAWVILILSLSLLAVLTVHLVLEIVESSETQTQREAAAEIKFLEQLVGEFLQQGAYADAQALVGDWGQRQPAIASINLVASNGFSIAEYQRTAPASRAYVVQADIEYSYRGNAKLSLSYDFAQALAERKLLIYETLGAYLVVVLITTYLTRTIIQRQREAAEHQALSQRLARINHELEQEISQREATEQALHEEKENAEVTLQSIGDGVIATDATGRITRMNSVAETLTGWSADEACGLMLGKVMRLHDDHGGDIESPVDTVLRRGKVVGLGNHTILTARDGREYQIADSAAPIHGRRGAIDGVVMVFRNVTEEYNMRQALADSERRFRRMTDNLAEHFLYSHGTDGVFTYVTPSITNVLGYTPEDFYSHFDKYLTDNPINEAVLVHTEGSIAGQPQPAYELEILHHDGSAHVLEVREVPVLDDDGRVIAVEGIAHDITERKTIDRELALAASVFHESTDGIVITDRDGVVMRSNAAFTRITGYSHDAIAGKPMSTLRSDRHEDSFYHDMWQSLESQGAWQGELWNQRQDGSVYPQWMTITRLSEEHSNQARAYVAIFSDISAFKEAQEEIARLAYHDSLTGLPNRSLLLDRLDTALGRSRRAGEIDALLFLDLDHFKHINDSLGHGIGDAILCEVAHRLRDHIREADTVARLGGDEFVVILTNLGQSTERATRRCHTVAEKIRQVLSEPYELQGHQLHTSPSIGIAMLPTDADNADDALKRADQAMYRAKASGRNTIQFFLPDMQADAESRLGLESELRHALVQSQFALVYQPLVEIASGRVIGAEVLLRWEHPERGTVSPAEFIAVAEESGLILELGEWVLAEACSQQRRWLDQGLDVVPLSINVSAMQFRQRNLVDRIAHHIRRLDLDARLIHLELTESVLMHDMDSAIRVTEELASMGIGLSIDDFGTGYSSLSYLRRFSIDRLKIDRSFIDEVVSDSDDAVITTTIISMARNLKLSTVAEGVETIEQLDYLRDQGCDIAQGWLCYRALPAERFKEVLQQPLWTLPTG